MSFEDRPADTTPQAWAAYLGLIQQMNPSEKLRLIFMLSANLRALAEAGVRYRFPDASEHEVLLRTAALYLDRQTMIRAYGWDPQSDESIPGSA